MNRYIALIKANLVRLKRKCSISNTSILCRELAVDENLLIRNSKLSGRIRIGASSKINSAELHGNITIGKHCAVNGPSTFLFSQVNSIEIGSFCSIAHGVTIIEYDHIIDRPSTYFMSQNIFNQGMENDIVSSGSIKIGHDVWIGANSVILSGVKIGDGAIIAAGSIVTKNVPSYAIVAGNPAKIIKYRFSQKIQDEINLCPWWEWGEEKIRSNSNYFLSTLK